jgi:exonuclease III
VNTTTKTEVRVIYFPAGQPQVTKAARDLPHAEQIASEHQADAPLMESRVVVYGDWMIVRNDSAVTR